MTRAELKQQAKDTLKGRWGTIIGMVILYELIILALSFIGNFIPLVGPILVAVISIPLSFGFIGQLLKFSRKQEVGIVDFFSIGFNNFSKSWSIFFNTILKLLPYVIGMIIVGILLGVSAGVAAVNEDVGMILVMLPIVIILFMVVYIMMLIKSLLYILTDYIGNDTDNLSGKEIVNRSAELMKGHRWEFFVLQLSFLGWALLASITFGIGLIWLTPYMEITNVKFYEYIAGSNTNNSDETIKNVE